MYFGVISSSLQTEFGVKSCHFTDNTQTNFYLKFVETCDTKPVINGLQLKQIIKICVESSHVMIIIMNHVSEYKIMNMTDQMQLLMHNYDRNENKNHTKNNSNVRMCMKMNGEKK